MQTLPANNKELLAAIRESKKAKEMSPALIEQILNLVERISRRKKYSGYTWLDEMKGDAILNLVKFWANFDETKSDNPAAYYSRAIDNSFKRRIKNEKKHLTINDELCISTGNLPSYGYNDDEA